MFIIEIISALCSTTKDVKFQKFPIVTEETFGFELEIGDLMIIYGTTNIELTKQTSSFSLNCGTNKKFIKVHI